MSKRMTIATLVSIGTFSIAMSVSPNARAASKEGSVPSAVPYAVTLDEVVGPAENVAPAEASRERQETPGDAAAALFTLFGFLGLIAGNLVRWSGDRSAKSNPSVFS